MPTEYFLDITSPAQNSKIRDTQLIVNGTAAGEFTHPRPPFETESREVDVEISVSGVGTQVQRRVLGNWQRTFTVISSGPKTITARIIGQNLVKTRRVIVVFDEQAPVLTVTQPTQGQEIRDHGPNFKVNLAGKATDNSKLSIAQYRVDNGNFQNVQINLDTATEKSWDWSKTDIPLNGLGEHQILIRARDQEGNATETSRTVRCVDSGKPLVNITNPASNLHTITWQEGGVETEISGTATDPATGVQSVQWSLDGEPFKNANNESGTWSSWSFKTDLISAGLHNFEVIATDGAGNTSEPENVQIDLAEPFELDDIGYAPYLTDLMSFLGNRIRSVSDSSKIDGVLLKNSLHQNFSRLNEVDNLPVASEPVAQVRIAVEVLRSYLSSTTQFDEYLKNAYQLLLANFGTSHAEVRLARTADEITRESLANRLGLPASGLEQIFISLNSLSEQELENVFGLPDTTKDPLAGVNQAALLTLQLSSLRSKWVEQDKSEINKSAFPVPVIDPDVISESDLKNPAAGNAAYDLWVHRKLWGADQREQLRQERELQGTALQGFEHIIELALGDINLLELEEDYSAGIDVEPKLKTIPLSISELFVLIGLRKLAQANTVTDDEWSDVYDLLLQVKKQREFKIWATQENETGLTLESNSFVQVNSRPPLAAFRSSWRKRRNWENKLDARINQKDSLIQGHRLAIESTEEIVLPMLRDQLIATIGRNGFPDQDIADWLTQRLSISFKYSGNQKLSRLEQAVETLQDLILTLRTGRLNNLSELPVGTEMPRWELALSANYTESDFDEEWNWVGSFATWQGAMFAFGYPENYLLPTLRDKREWTNAFRQFVKDIRQAGRLTSGKALSIAANYVELLSKPESEGGDGISFEIIDQIDGEDINVTLTSELTKQQLHGRRLRSIAELEPHIDEHGRFKPDAPAHLKEIFFFTSIFLALSLQSKGEYLAALDWYQIVYAYELPLQDRKIYFALTTEERIPTEFRRSPDTWLLGDPSSKTKGLDVFNIANDRANALTRFTIISVVRCYLAFADAEFTRETNESIPYARSLYNTALDLIELLHAPSPLARWSFNTDMGAQVPDSEGNGHLLELTGVTWTENGWQGGAIEFDRSSTAKVSHSPALALGKQNTDFSVAFALFLREDATGSIRSLVKKGTGDNQTPGITLQANDNRIRYRISTSGNLDEGGISEAEINLNEWMHIAYVKQGQLLRLYINGQFDSQSKLDGESIGFDDPLIIFSGFQDQTVNALCDEINLFDRALSPDAVIALAGIDSFPTNPIISSLHNHAELNLKKLRSGRNIAGLERIRSEPVAAELVISDGGLVPPISTNLRPTAYRYSTLIERAKQLVSLAQQIEANFFAALEKRDAEAYTLLNAQHDVHLTKETVALQDIRIQDADSNIDLMTLHQDRAQIQSDTYNEWISAGVNKYEQAMLDNYRDLKHRRNLISDLDVGIAIAGAALQVSQAAYGKEGAAVLAASALGAFNVEKAIFSRAITDLEFEAQNNQFNANLERRKDEWRLQGALANQDSQIAAQQIFQAQINKQIVEQERAIAGIRSDQAQAVVEFLNNKFTNVELYEWMSDVLSEVYNYFLQQATAMALLAVNQLTFERQERPPAFIRSDYWQVPNDTQVSSNDEEPDRRGITGSARLLQDIFQLDQHAFDTNQRKLQLIESFSLARLVPFEFQQFRETGVLSFATPMSLFDQNYPGHYLRLIKRIRVSVIGLIPPTRGIRASLTSAGVSHVITGGEVFRRTEVRRPSEMIAFTSPSNATGLFELQPENELLFPFETMGVDSNWELQLPKASNPFNFDAISDVIFTVEYTALHSANYQQQMVQELDRSFKSERAYSIKRDFPDLWYNLNHPDTLVDETSGDIHASIDIAATHFPPNISSLEVDKIIVFFDREENFNSEISMIELRLNPNRSSNELSFDGATSMDGVISTQRANAINWLPIIGESPVGQWTLVFADTQEFRDWFANEQITDILFVLGYSGETPPWPT